MPKRIDVETIIDKLVTYAKTVLPQKITAINAEKNDGVTLQTVSPQAWFFQSLDDGNHNFDPFVFYFIDSVSSKTAGKDISRSVNLEFDIFLLNDYADDLQKKVLRYQRALEETMCDAWSKIDGFGIEMGSLTPLDVKIQNSSNVHKVFGVTINFEVA